MEWYYALIIAVLAVGGDWSLIYVRTKVSKNVIKQYAQNWLQTETERSEFEGPDGKIYSKITAMVLVFLVEDGTELKFAVNNKMKAQSTRATVGVFNVLWR